MRLKKSAALLITNFKTKAFTTSNNTELKLLSYLQHEFLINIVNKYIVMPHQIMLNISIVKIRNQTNFQI